MNRLSYFVHATTLLGVPRSIARSRVDEGGPSYRDSLNLIRTIGHPLRNCPIAVLRSSSVLECQVSPFRRSRYEGATV